ncbi:TBC1 domain family member 17-like [Amphibalanus amphitrite]|uniref:TBC1 domain family member 17-like n=1 Tax=Amphibalanus amphitrite TaxID=1232801 RepID=UPI001C8FAA0D|nr:TBC1 domain family member 17-like [Amphibalanus amphitrite]XP_043210604.1 TBC1 domain family member 17-like [Amphibalanus amphitrite]XP_043210605.1 TBC1 domain family member 17-like [Amphibalanus amphitrite]XP_043210606.1 TBC1 domain family member 17-like [Amphibalanus amphitrite]XP_043210607.1 TBC1 domain family member 17-like [Amphibalanus amphitrite]XP_043210609.1 TBC1 domain family member 17-like [Amphibalanus amphitrite]XP_043210610.1 TBC1 domain family member 17-like [Amphibalanus am
MLSSSSSPDIEERDSPDMDEDSGQKQETKDQAPDKGVIIFSIPDVALVGSQPHSNRIVPGSLHIVDKGHGKYMQWQRSDSPSPERSANGGRGEPAGAARSPDRSEWALLEPAVGYHHSHDNGKEDSVSMSPPAADSAEFRPRPIEVDLSEIRSLRVTERGTLCVIVQSDGSTTSPLRFPSSAHMDSFLDMVNSVTPIVRSCKDKALYLAEEQSRPARATQGTVDTLYGFARFSERLVGTGIKLVRDFHQDPRAATLTGIGKVAEIVLNRGLEDHRPEEAIADALRQHSFELEPPRLQSTQHEGFEVVTEIRLGEKRPVARQKPLTQREWDDAHDVEGRILDPDALRRRIFHGGVEPQLRASVWPFLLDCERPELTTEERRAARDQRRDDYFRMKLQWASMSEKQLTRFTGLRDRRALVEKDVTRTDRGEAFFSGTSNITLLHDILVTYCMYNFDLGYVQGMSDLLSPILFVVKDEVDAFWCFVGFMERVCGNFELTQKGMEQQFSDLHALLQVYDPTFCSYLDRNESSQMSFTFRWLLVWFKRELDWPDIQRLWEVLWTGLPCSNFVLLVALSVLVQQRSTIIESELGFSAIVKHINDLSMHIDLESSLKLAETIYGQFRDGSRVPAPVLRILDLPVPPESDAGSSPPAGSAPAAAGADSSPAGGQRSHDSSVSEDERSYEIALASQYM